MSGDDESGYVPPDVTSHDVEPVAVEYAEPDMTSHDVEAPPSPEYVPPYIHDDAAGDGGGKPDKPKTATKKATAKK